MVPPTVTDEAAARRFERLAREAGLDPHDRWVGGYVEEVWRYSRHVYEAAGLCVRDRLVLEFGCNVGATAIVLALFGARVAAVDPNGTYVRIAAANAERYGVADRIRFLQVADTRHLPIRDRSFDLVTCNSVLEYVDRDHLPEVQREIDRVLQPGGIILVSNTSSRLWPYEMHSRSWVNNYWPVFVERWFRTSLVQQRGVAPWRVRYGFGHYENMDRADGGRAYLTSRRNVGAGPAHRLLMAAANVVALICGTSLGLVAPTISVRLRKR